MSRRATLVVAITCVFVGGAIAIVLNRGEPVSAAERPEVEAAVISLLEADTGIGRLPEDLAGRRTVLASGRSERRATVKRVWVPARVAHVGEEWERALEAVADDDSYDAYYSNRLTVTKWEDLQQTRSGVKVTFTGHMDYRGRQWPGWSQEPLTRFRVELHRADGGSAWLLADEDQDVLVAP